MMQEKLAEPTKPVKTDPNHKPTREERKLRSALAYLFGPASVHPEVERPARMRVYVDTPNTRMCGFVSYKAEKAAVRLKLGASVWLEPVAEVSRDAFVRAIHPFHERMHGAAATHEETRAAQAKAEKARVRKEKREQKMLLDTWEREYARSVAKRRPWYVGGQCSRAQTRFVGVGTCTVMARYYLACDALRDFSDFVHFPAPRFAQMSKLPRGGTPCLPF